MAEYNSGVLVIGVVGGIASGKSSFTKCLASFYNTSVVVIDADKLGHEAYLPGTGCYNTLVQYFGASIVNEKDKTINRPLLGSIIFQDEEKRKILNSIVWPEIARLLKMKLDQIKREPLPVNQRIRVAVLEAAILLEAKWHESLTDEVWCVVGPSDEQVLHRLMLRNGLTENEAKKRIQSQMSLSERLSYANLVITNDSSLQDLEDKAKKAYNDLLFRYKGITAFELVDVVSVSENRVIAQKKRGTVRSFNLPHRATYCIIGNGKGQFYVQQRSFTKDYCPGLLDPAPGGVLGAGENYEDNAKREMEEEMGLNGLDFQSLFDFWFQDQRTKVWGRILFARCDNLDVHSLKLQVEEVQSVLIMTAEEILSLVPNVSITADGYQAFKLFHDSAYYSKFHALNSHL